VKHIPERTFRQLLRLADTISKPESRAELRTVLYRIARAQPARPRGYQSPITIQDDSPSGPGDLEL
jgi:hypothetical protein